MTPTDVLLLNFEEIRRRSLKLWVGIPVEFFNWRPDAKAMSFIEMIRHVLETENIYTQIIKNKGGNASDFISPWKDLPYSSLEGELEFAAPFRKTFLETVGSFTADELNAIQIVRKEKKTRTLGDFILRCSYHESVHTGQFLSYLRTLNVDRRNIWD
jgi:hypothetical protein